MQGHGAWRVCIQASKTVESRTGLSSNGHPLNFYRKSGWSPLTYVYSLGTIENILYSIITEMYRLSFGDPWSTYMVNSKDSISSG